MTSCTHAITGTVAVLDGVCTRHTAIRGALLH